MGCIELSEHGNRESGIVLFSFTSSITDTTDTYMYGFGIFLFRHCTSDL